MFCIGPPTTSSFVSTASIVTFPPRPSCPAEEMTTVFVFVGSKFGAGALPGMSNASSRKLRPFSGRVSTSREAMTLSQMPKRMAIIGAGAIGCEFADFYNAIGTEEWARDDVVAGQPSDAAEAAYGRARQAVASSAESTGPDGPGSPPQRGAGVR